ncbi:MAG: hypothetical protein ASARMPRED_007615 [Alectoria sarmentosa]|nr:MAG: hypothetical protein ASARMPRED_007615 [Alectoria sarmentosa]
MSDPDGKCFYEVLGVPPQAQKQEIKNAYRRLALRFHPDKNHGVSSAKELFQEIQAAYETLSEDNKRAQYDANTVFLPSNPSRRPWREPSYEPYNAYARDPPFWSAELREMTVQKCERITKIQHLESQIRELVANLDDLFDREDRALSKERRAQGRFSFIKLRPPQVNAQRHRDFLTKSACINTHLDRVKNELRTAHEDHRKLLEKDNARKTWWARERIRRVEEANRRAATTAAEAARRRAEKARQDGERDMEAARVAEEIRQQAREEAIRTARAARAEEERRKRAERARQDPEAAREAEREAQDWLAWQRKETLEPEWKDELPGVRQNFF